MIDNLLEIAEADDSIPLVEVNVMVLAINILNGHYADIFEYLASNMSMDIKFINNDL